VRLRRRYWRCFLGGITLFAVFGTPLFVLGDKMNPMARAILTSRLGGAPPHIFCCDRSR